MASALQSTLTGIQQNDYTTVVTLVAVGYDYVLTFSTEVEYIWGKPWTMVSTLFILVRYCGLFDLMMLSLLGSSFLTGPVKVGGSLLLSDLWIHILFLGPADFLMMLRVWAMYNRSRLIIGTLFILFILEILSVIAKAVAYSVPKDLIPSVLQILDISMCAVQLTPTTWQQASAILQIVFGGTMCLLGIVQFMRQSLQVYRTTKQWQLNRYMNLFVRQGILYFIAIFLSNFVTMLGIAGKLPSSGWQMIVSYILANVPRYTVTSRFIMSIRELHAHSIQGRRMGEIDTGFGLSTLSEVSTSETRMIFADSEQDEGMESAGISMELGTAQPLGE